MRRSRPLRKAPECVIARSDPERAVFGLGETLHGPTQGALIADLTPPHLRGRSFALSSNSWELGFVIGPAIGGFVLAAAPFALWPLAAGACVAAAAATILCEREIPSGLRLTPGQV